MAPTPLCTSDFEAIYGVTYKVLTMTSSEVLMATPSSRPNWFEAGSQMIAVDTLVHNFLHRTGILKQLEPLMPPEPHATSKGVAPTFCDVSRHTLMLVDLTRPIGSVRHQCRFGHRGKHTTCRPAKNKFPQPGMPVPAHDNEIGICIGCI